MAFTRIVPMLRDIGLWGKSIRDAFVDMGVMSYATMDLDSVMADDEAQANAIERERRREVAQAIAAGARSE